MSTILIQFNINDQPSSPKFEQYCDARISAPVGPQAYAWFRRSMQRDAAADLRAEGTADGLKAWRGTSPDRSRRRGTGNCKLWPECCVCCVQLSIGSAPINRSCTPRTVSSCRLLSIHFARMFLPDPNNRSICKLDISL